MSIDMNRKIRDIAPKEVWVKDAIKRGATPEEAENHYEETKDMTIQDLVDKAEELKIEVAQLKAKNELNRTTINNLIKKARVH